MFDPQQLLDQFLGNNQQQEQGQRSTRGRDLATGAVAGGVIGLLLGGKSGRKLAKKGLQVGAMAALGGLAYKAYSDYKAGKPPLGIDLSGAGSTRTIEAEARKAEGTPFLPAPDAERADLASGILRAMIAAAKADGHINADEQKRIFEALGRMDLDADAKAFVMDELMTPLNIDMVVSAAKTPEQAAEIYAASLMAIDASGAAERGYLAQLAARLRLEPGLVEHLHAAVEPARAET
ncbi:MAG: tellurite resistance TerB family protein [Hyphomicrobiales bacterium]